jgi:hydroxymethylglutaryl-CoA reductase (NADPH)
MGIKLENLQDLASQQFDENILVKTETESFSQHKLYSRNTSHESLLQRWGKTAASTASMQQVLDETSLSQANLYRHRVENYIGTVKVPVGLVGPVYVNGLFAQGGFYVPLATTEAALVASYNRGAMAIAMAGGANAMLVSEAVHRSPGFTFHSLPELKTFLEWFDTQLETVKQVAEATTRHGKLQDIEYLINGNNLYLILSYTTGNASGQNMVTIATQAVVDYLCQHTPVTFKAAYIEINLSGDKKANHMSFLEGRGKQVTAEVQVPREVVINLLQATPEAIADGFNMSSHGALFSGAIGNSLHCANALAAFYIACGQDVACVSESSVGLTRMEVLAQGDLYYSITLPNLMVATIGGGTQLPSQHACLDILGVQGQPNAAQQVAEILAVTCLAGEISIGAAVVSNRFTRAHKKLARK